VSQVNNQELLEAHAGWESELQAILKVTFSPTLHNQMVDYLTIEKCIDSPSRWAVHTVRKLKTWVRGRVVLLGDSVSYSPRLRT
jgi:salicylate hydroxylase